jgi:hypothetical protein
MVVLKPMMKPAKSNHGGAGIDKCTSQMKRRQKMRQQNKTWICGHQHKCWLNEAERF